MTHFCGHESPIGSLLLVATERGLSALEFDYDRARLGNAREKADWVESESEMKSYCRALDRYFAGKLREFDFEVDLHGTDFQKRCWQALLRIPYGQTKSYADIATEVGCPRGFRAVGMANHDNPVAIVVPCHRVITSDGKLGGYGGGLEVKKKLLALEGVRLELF